MNYKYTNKLINEKSPYLLQHAHNPVNWYPWSKLAFEKAKNENKPIFLSIGYSTCHWCHVMEKESFEDKEVADILNKHFISIKVDREERPDIDSIYMNACQALTGRGGWPLTIFLNYDQKPFFAGTYFPKNSNFHQNGLIDILNRITDIWKNNKLKLLDASDSITNAITNPPTPTTSQNVYDNIHEILFKELSYVYDSRYGGFADSPKFPLPSNLYFLLRYYNKTKNEKALSMITHTLESMYRGGIYDHIGYGFSRYSTDTKWLVPHFEKMLYDNALLSLIYTEAFQVTNNNLFSKIANDIITYIMRDMMSPKGGFYSAEDADSEGIEGKFYVWKYDEILDVLGNDDGIKFCKQFNITKEGNFEGNNIVNLIYSKDITLDNNIREKLFAYRDKRIHPHKDDKILTAWNGLMIVSLSVAGRVFKNNTYIETAKKTVEFIYNNLINSDGRLLARHRDGHSSILAYSEDYSFLIWGLIELYESTFDIQYIEKAINLNEQLIKYFWDEKSDGLFLYGNDAEQLITRPKEFYDGVTPSANSVSTLNSLRLSRLTGNTKLEELATRQIKSFSSNINSSPSSCTFMISAYLFMTSTTQEIVILGNKNNENTIKMIDLIYNKFNPNVTTVLKDKSDDVIKLSKIFPYIVNYDEVNKMSTAYICSNNTCSMPITDISEFEKII